MYEKSIELFERAQQSIPGGVNSPVRAFKSVGGNPIFIKSAKGAYLYDEDDRQYIDYINSWGPMILGHAHEDVIEAVQQQLAASFSFGAPSRLEVEMAELIKQLCPGVDMIRMVNSGTEACMSALRLARAYTGKNKVIKFEGCYHGHADPFLINAGSGTATLGIQSVPGVTHSTAADTLTASFNDSNSVKQLAEQNKNQVAAIIIEPVAGNMGCVPPLPGFLQQLRKLCDEQNIILIFDEVMTGFRLAPGGAQELYSIEADLITYGKIIGGGLPVGAYGGKKEIMSAIAPVGKVYQAGTLSGNPLAMRAGYTTLNILAQNRSCYEQLDRNTTMLAEGVKSVFDAANIPVCINHVGSMMSVHFTKQPVKDFMSASVCDIELFKRYFHYCLERGIYLPPSAYETWFMSTAITKKEIDYTIQTSCEFASNL